MTKQAGCSGAASGLLIDRKNMTGDSFSEECTWFCRCVLRMQLLSKKEKCGVGIASSFTNR